MITVHFKSGDSSYYDTDLEVIHDAFNKAPMGTQVVSLCSTKTGKLVGIIVLANVERIERG